MLIIKIKLKKLNLRVHFLALRIAFFGGFENYIILSSKVESPQRKLGSLRNLKLKLKRH